MSDPGTLLVVTLAEAGGDAHVIAEYVGNRAQHVVAVRERDVEDDVRRALAEGPSIAEAAVAIDQRFMGFLAKRAIDTLRALGVPIPTLIHPRALVAPDARLGMGVRVAAGAVIAPSCTVGDHARVLERAVLSPGCSVGAFTTLDPGVVVGERSRVGAHCWLRIGAAVEVGSVIESSCELAPLSTVRGHVPEGTVHIVGLDAPARIHRFGSA